MFKPFPWPAEKLCTKYCVGVGVEGMNSIRKGPDDGENLCEALEEISGVDMPGYEEYDDPFIYFSIVPNCDNGFTHTKILEVIKRFISDD